MDFERTPYNCTGWILSLANLLFLRFTTLGVTKSLSWDADLDFFSPFKLIYFVFTGSQFSSTHWVLGFYLLLRELPFQDFTTQQNIKHVLNIKPVLKFPQGKCDANECSVALLNMDDLCISELCCCELPLTKRCQFCRIQTGSF